MLADFPDDFRYVLGLHEIVAVGMADGFAQASGRTTMVNLHTAPGVGNGMGAIFNAQANKTPLLVTAGQQARSLDDAPGQPHQPRRGPDAASARQVELRAAAGGGRAARAGARRAPRLAAAARPRVRVDPDGRLGGRGRSGGHAAPAGAHGLRVRRRPAPAAVRELGERLGRRGPARPRGGPDLDSRRGWDAAVALAERLRLPVWATPATGGGRLGFPENHPAFQGHAAAGRGPARRRRSPGTISCWWPGSSVLPVLPQHPGAAAAGGRVARGDHQRSGRGGARPDGRRAGGRPRR